MENLNRGTGAALTFIPGAGSPRTPHIRDAAPMWVAALNAAIHDVEVNRNDQLQWDRGADCAFFINSGATRRIEALGVTLRHGETLVVCWRQGETAYSMEVFAARA
ncbi:MAG TPA: hypothetical protein VML19_35590 [Verrucomicrobiae bacterium]|nr:hypothetical protein [Verrucomicrobiae bacterium]